MFLVKASAPAAEGGISSVLSVRVRAEVQASLRSHLKADLSHLAGDL